VLDPIIKLPGCLLDFVGLQFKIGNHWIDVLEMTLPFEVDIIRHQTSDVV
jgi:hypothetical protein